MHLKLIIKILVLDNKNIFYILWSDEKTGGFISD